MVEGSRGGLDGLFQDVVQDFLQAGQHGLQELPFPAVEVEFPGGGEEDQPENGDGEVDVPWGGHLDGLGGLVPVPGHQREARGDEVVVSPDGVSVEGLVPGVVGVESLLAPGAVFEVLVLAALEGPDGGLVQELHQSVFAVDGLGTGGGAFHGDESQVAHPRGRRAAGDVHLQVAGADAAQAVGEVEHAAPLAEDPVHEIPVADGGADAAVGQVFPVCDVQDGALFRLDDEVQPAGGLTAQVHGEEPSVGAAWEGGGGPGEGEAVCVGAVQGELHGGAVAVVRQVLATRGDVVPVGHLPLQEVPVDDGSQGEVLWEFLWAEEESGLADTGLRGAVGEFPDLRVELGGGKPIPAPVQDRHFPPLGLFAVVVVEEAVPQLAGEEELVAVFVGGIQGPLPLFAGAVKGI